MTIVFSTVHMIDVFQHMILSRLLICSFLNYLKILYFSNFFYYYNKKKEMFTFKTFLKPENKYDHTFKK